MSEAIAVHARRDGRVRVRLPVDLGRESHAQKIDEEAYTIDLSSLGIRLWTVLALAPGERVAIVTPDEEDRPIQGRVVWVGSAGTVLAGQVGIEFLRALFRPI